eukprot:364651-Chlamydomonas_euryale.AAC.3
MCVSTFLCAVDGNLLIPAVCPNVAVRRNWPSGLQGKDGGREAGTLCTRPCLQEQVALHSQAGSSCRVFSLAAAPALGTNCWGRLWGERSS